MKEKVYMVCDSGKDFMGNCCGRILSEDGRVIGWHVSSNFSFLRHDLKNKLDDPDKYEIIDLIGQEVPERFRIQPEDEHGHA